MQKRHRYALYEVLSEHLKQTCHRTLHPLRLVEAAEPSSWPESACLEGMLDSASTTAVCTLGRRGDPCGKVASQRADAYLVIDVN